MQKCSLYVCVQKKDADLSQRIGNEIEIDMDLVENFRLQNQKNNGILGVFVHGPRTDKESSRPIKHCIKKAIKKQPCVHCGSFSELVHDHKNDLYNDPRVLSSDSQVLSDFQSLCNSCNLRKREVVRKERESGKIYSVKNIPMYSGYDYEFPWEKKLFDPEDIRTKEDTYWYDPIEFHRKIRIYERYVLPLLPIIKNLYR